MTALQKKLIGFLLKGCYMRPWMSRSNKISYRIYDPTDRPVLTVRQSTPKTLAGKLWLFKKDKQHRLTLNLSLVRQLHGKNFLKKEYKRIYSLKNKNHVKD